MVTGYTPEEREHMKKQYLSHLTSERQDAIMDIDETWKMLSEIEKLRDIRSRAPMNVHDQFKSWGADIELDTDIHPENSYEALERRLKRQIKKAEELDLSNLEYIKKIKGIAYS